MRVAKFVTYTINSNDSEINSHDGTHNTLLGLLAKGDQNCYQKEEAQAPADMFAQNVQVADGETQATDGLMRNTDDLSSHVVQTAAQRAAEAAKQKAAMEAAAAEAAQKEAEQKAREEEERRKREEEERRKKKPTWKTKFTSWLGDIMTPDE